MTRNSYNCILSFVKWKPLKSTKIVHYNESINIFGGFRMDEWVLTQSLTQSSIGSLAKLTRRPTMSLTQSTWSAKRKNDANSQMANCKLAPPFQPNRSPFRLTYNRFIIHSSDWSMLIEFQRCWGEIISANDRWRIIIDLHTTVCSLPGIGIEHTWCKSRCINPNGHRIGQLNICIRAVLQFIAFRIISNVE